VASFKGHLRNSPTCGRILESLGNMMERSKGRINSPQLRAGLSQSEEFHARSDGVVLA
jgi:hypothetical protein